MFQVLIYGAGSIGNHLAHGCRRKGWAVTIRDTDPAALRRTREEIYPARYGGWDPEIRLQPADEPVRETHDLVIVGTPPDLHLPVAEKVLSERPPRALLIEKPLCTPSLEGGAKLLELAEKTGTFVACGYNHVLAENSRLAGEVLAGKTIGNPISITAGFREYWGGIFTAHPWLAGPQDTYLGFSSRGGGAGGEHSHAINIWQHFARLCGLGRIVEVSAVMDMVETDSVQYDRLCLINVVTENGYAGHIVQDVVTDPPTKSLRIQGDKGFLEWVVNDDSSHDAVKYRDEDGKIRIERIAKTRPDDFKGEIDHLENILEGAPGDRSPIALKRGLDTMMVIAAAHLSHRYKKRAVIRYDRGYRLESIEI